MTQLLSTPPQDRPMVGPLGSIGVRVIAVAALMAGVGGVAGCTSEESPPELERIDQPAQVDEERLGGQPGAINESDQGG